MRLLTRDKDGKLVLRTFDSDDLPLYAILSHTWHEDNSKEVTFQDVEAGTAEDKDGYDKIQFCETQAATDKLHHFWIDTCCINKNSDSELSESINSMFNWYQRSARCYVYLSDVSSVKHTTNEKRIHLWEGAFYKSRWFTRGWTLQELLAPVSVDFFSKEREHLGSKRTLARQISLITAIDMRVLQGDPLSGFTIDERLSWAKHRQTKRSEDKAYCLLGIVDVRMRLDYGEGDTSALARLRKRIQKSQR
jgi:hypothetical protein